MGYEEFPWLYENVYAETRDVVISLAQGNFKYVTVETMDDHYVVKTKFSEGSNVNVHSKIRNDGDTSTAKIVVTDLDTLKEVVTWTIPEVLSGDTLDHYGALGKMPGRTWRLRLELTP